MIPGVLQQAEMIQEKKRRVKKPSIMFATLVDPAILQEFRKICKSRKISYTSAIQAAMSSFIAEANSRAT